MKKVLIVLAVCGINLFAQAPGSVVVTTSVIASAPATNPTIVCSFNIASGVIHQECTVGDTPKVMIADIKPAPGDVNGYVTSANYAGNTITALIKQPTAGGPITWEIAANGFKASGTF